MILFRPKLAIRRLAPTTGKALGAELEIRVELRGHPLLREGWQRKPEACLVQLVFLRGLPVLSEKWFFGSFLWAGEVFTTICDTIQVINEVAFCEVAGFVCILSDNLITNLL